MVSDRFVVIVEDDDLLREVLAGLIGDTGIRCMSFPNGDDALIHLLGYRSDCVLVIVDHDVPGQLSGSDLANIVGDEWPELPLVIMSGYGAETLRMPETSCFLRKPWAVKELLGLVSSLVPNEGKQAVRTGTINHFY